MKAKIAITVSALLLGTITTANADLYIQSPQGLTQSQWNATDTYRNFNCPAGYGRGEGVDMNFTSTRSDDYWYVSCTPIVVTPTPIYTTTPTPVVSTTPAPTETSTVTVTPTVTPTPSTTTTPAVTDTTTATSASITVDSLYAQIMALFTQLLALIAKMNR